jgi:tetratricopeptide (TPR) repeat protein
VGFTAFIAVGSIAVGLVAVGWMAVVPAGAQTPQQISGCSGGKDGPEQKIAACTAVIQSGLYAGKSLALVFNNRANGYLKKGDDDRAVADYDQALKLDPNYALAYNNRGNVYFRKKNYDRAIADYDQAIRIDPLPGVVADDRGRTSTNVYNNRGYAYFAKKDFARAIADYDRAVKVDPQDPLTYNNRALAHTETRDFDRALADFGEAIRARLRPRHCRFRSGNPARPEICRGVLQPRQRLCRKGAGRPRHRRL